MSESAIADFVATFNSGATSRADPVTGRVLLSRKRLVLAADGDRQLTVPLERIVDVAVGHVPKGLGEFFDATVTVAFERGNGRQVAAIEAGDDEIDQFSTLLFAAVCDGARLWVSHPARREGLVRDTGFRTASLSMAADAVRFDGEDRTVRVALGSVVGVDSVTREVEGRDRPMLAVSHVGDGGVVTTVVGAETPRLTSLLGRYLRLEFADLATEVADLALEPVEVELLVALYASGGLSVERLATVLDVQPDRTESMVADLGDRGLVEASGEAPTLTRLGLAATIRTADDAEL